MERTVISFDYAIKGILRDKANFDILDLKAKIDDGELTVFEITKMLKDNELI